MKNAREMSGEEFDAHLRRMLDPSDAIHRELAGRGTEPPQKAAPAQPPTTKPASSSPPEPKPARKSSRGRGAAYDMSDADFAAEMRRLRVRLP